MPLVPPKRFLLQPLCAGSPVYIGGAIPIGNFGELSGTFLSVGLQHMQYAARRFQTPHNAPSSLNHFWMEPPLGPCVGAYGCMGNPALLRWVWHFLRRKIWD